MRNRKESIYKDLARRIKAEKLANVIQGAGGTSAEAAKMGDRDWTVAVALAKVNPPGPETKRLVIEFLQAREDAAQELGRLDAYAVAA
jgi:hypothetical protein